MTTERIAEQMIGWDDGTFRIKGGRAKYEAVMYNCANGGNKVKLAKLVPAGTMKIREVSRYVDFDTVLVFDDPVALDKYESRFFSDGDCLI